MYFFITKSLHHSPVIDSLIQENVLSFSYVPDPMLGNRDTKLIRQALKVRAGKGDRHIRR